MNLTELGRTVAKFAPLLGSILPIPGGAAIGAVIAKQFGGDINDPEALAQKIQADPEAQIKLLTIQSNERLEIERIAVQKLQAENEDRASQRNLQLETNKTEAADRADARNANNQNNKTIDDIIKGYLVFTLSVVIYLCLYALMKGQVEGVEANIVSGILGSAFTALLSMVYFYWGTSKSSSDKDSFLMKKDSK